MAQPNVAREPSMDEILASIRRIIESNDQVGPAGGIATSTEPQGFSVQPANDDIEDVPLTVDGTFEDEVDTQISAEAEVAQFRGAPLHPIHAEAPRSEPAPQKSLSLADVAARVRAASERNSAILREGGVIQPIVQVIEPQARQAEPVAVAPEPVEPARRAEPVFAAFEQPREDRESVNDAGDLQQAEAQPLLSNSAGQQVAQAFQHLALAVDDAHRRSFDEIAAELLRPMLQEWLDDNLPTLVERLVREEIERVARGPRR